jgi:hypothetical protein
MSELNKSQTEMTEINPNSDKPILEKKSLIKSIFEFVGLLLAACLGFSLFGGTLFVLLDTPPKKDENWLGLIFVFIMACFYMFSVGLIGLVLTDALLEMLGLWKHQRQSAKNIFEKIGYVLEKLFKKPFNWLEKFFKVVLSAIGYLLLFIGWLIALCVFLFIAYWGIYLIGHILGLGFKSA